MSNSARVCSVRFRNSAYAAIISIRSATGDGPNRTNQGSLDSPPKSQARAQRGLIFGGLWGREDSNLRRLSRRVYSPFPLAARAHPRERQV